MNYKEYQNARNAAWRILLECGVERLPVKISGVCRSLGVEVKLYDSWDGNDGMSFLLEGKPVILVSRTVTPVRQRFTTAHELGHIILGHVDNGQLCNLERSTEDNLREQAANVFASRLLAPACVLWGCGTRTPEEIMDLCDISRQAAVFRAQRMELLYQRDEFLTSPLERAVFAQFLPFIRARGLTATLHPEGRPPVPLPQQFAHH